MEAPQEDLYTLLGVDRSATAHEVNEYDAATSSCSSENSLDLAIRGAHMAKGRFLRQAHCACPRCNLRPESVASANLHLDPTATGRQPASLDPLTAL